MTDRTPAQIAAALTLADATIAYQRAMRAYLKDKWSPETRDAMEKTQDQKWAAMVAYEDIA